MRVRVLTIVILLVLFSAVFIANAMANGVCGNITFTVSPGTGIAGSSASASGYGVMADDSYSLYWDATGGTPLATGTTDGSGNFSTTVTIPADATVGAHNIIFTGTDAQENPVACPQPFTVMAATAAGGVQPDAYTTLSTLPSTGVTVLAPLAGLLLGGAAFVAHKRRS